MLKPRKELDGGKLSYTINEAVAATGIGETNFRRLIKSGRIRAARVGKKYVVPRPEIERWLREELAVD